jgi:hypothetical protein
MPATETVANLPDLTIEHAESWIAAALAEARALRQYDAQLYPTSSDPITMQAAHQLHDAWRRWADAANLLHDRLRPLRESRAYLVGSHDLDYTIAWVRATLEVSPEAMQSRREQIARGQVTSVEEARRELRTASGR